MTAYGGAENYGTVYRYQVSAQPISQISFAPKFNIYNPVITSNAILSISENTMAVTTVTATDADFSTQSLTYSISSGVDATLFSINSSTGELGFITAPDFEIPTDLGADNIYNFTVQVSDGELVSTQEIIVTVNMVNDNAPMITSVSTLSIAENNTAASVVTAADADLPSQPLTYSIVGGTDSALFNVNSSTGELNFNTAPDFEIPADSGSDNIYNVTIQASDGELVSTQEIIVTVNAVNDNIPIITSSGNLAIPENNTAVTTVNATDADLPSQPQTYSIIGGADSALFTINASTGVLDFITARDYEIPNDVGADNIYNIVVQASDGALKTTQNIAISILPVNDNSPVITSLNTFSIPENTVIITTLATMDAAKFLIMNTTGELKFITAPDFEAPVDSNLDNIYKITVQVSDGTYNSILQITISVMNAD
jgi:serralysin